MATNQNFEYTLWYHLLTMAPGSPGRRKPQNAIHRALRPSSKRVQLAQTYSG